MIKLLKTISRKILYEDIKAYTDEINDLKSNVSSFISLVDKKDLEHSEQLKQALGQKCKLEKENEILRKYYDLDREPSDEIKTKIHIDLEVNRLKEENQKLMLIAFSRNAYIQQPCPYYPNWSYRTF